MSEEAPILIVGAGQAGATAAASLRAFGYAGRIVVVGSEHAQPYERPPLSKAVLSDATMDGRIAIHAADLYAQQAIELRLGTQVTAIDASLSLARFSDGDTLRFSQCLLATGGKARTLPSLPEGTPRVHYMRTLADAKALRQAMREQTSVLVLGAGFLGLEVASTARSMGLEVCVLEAAPRVLPRAVPPEFSAWLEQRARSAGVDLRLACTVGAMAPQPDGIALTLDGGSELSAALLVVAIGQSPDVALAQACGLELHPANGGIRIDATGRTSAARIFAAGDCTSQFQPLFGEEIRLESWQSANEQARVAAAAMLGAPTDAAAIPWFWTDQFGCNIQMLGMPAAGLHYHLRGRQSADEPAPKFLLLGLDAEARLRHAIAVNAGGDLRQLRALMEQGPPCDPASLCDVTAALRQRVREALAAATVPSLS